MLAAARLPTRVLDQVSRPVVLLDLGVEQAATAALSIARSAFLLRKGEVVFRGSAEQLRSEVDVLHGAYLGKARAPAQPVLR